MGVPEDIKLAYIESGVKYNVLDKVSGEYCMYDLNSQVTKPFIREHFLEGSFPFDTAAEAGDVVDFTVADRKYLVMNKTPDILENEIIEFSTVLYRANCSGEIKRPSETRVNYRTVTEWQTVQSRCYSLITEALFGYGLSQDEELGLLGLTQDELYIPSSYGIRLMDRFEPFSGEFKLISAVRKRRFPNIDVCTLEEDTRE